LSIYVSHPHSRSNRTKKASVYGVELLFDKIGQARPGLKLGWSLDNSASPVSILAPAVGANAAISVAVAIGRLAVTMMRRNRDVMYAVATLTELITNSI